MRIEATVPAVKVGRQWQPSLPFGGLFPIRINGVEEMCRSLQMERATLTVTLENGAYLVLPIAFAAQEGFSLSWEVDPEAWTCELTIKKAGT